MMRDFMAVYPNSMQMLQNHQKVRVGASKHLKDNNCTLTYSHQTVLVSLCLTIQSEYCLNCLKHVCNLMSGMFLGDLGKSQHDYC